MLKLQFVEYQTVQDPLKLQAFIYWIMLPKKLREPKTHGAFAKKIGVSQDTLTDWKRLPKFWREVQQEQQGHFRERAAEVLHGLTERAIGGNPSAIKLYLQYVLGWSEKYTFEEDIPRTLTEEEKKEIKNKLQAWSFPKVHSR